jgi:hypothetical protein
MSIPRRLWALRTERPAFVVLSAVTVATLAVWPAVDVHLRAVGLATPFGFNDYGAYSAAVSRWAAGDPIYVRNEGGGYHGSYLYPPIALALFVPFQAFEFTTAALLLGGLSLVSLWTALAAVARVLGCDLLVSERLALLLVLFGFQPALRDFKWGQISTLLTALLGFAFYAHELEITADSDGRSRRYLYGYGSGALTTLGSSVKLFYAPAGAHLLRDRRRLVGAVATAVALLAVSLVVFGVETHRAYLDVLLWGKGWGESRPPELWDVAAAYRPLYVLGGFGLPARFLGTLGVIGLALAARDAEGPTVRRATFALGIAAVPLLAPRADTHDLVVALVPAVVLLAVELARPLGRPSIPVLAVLLFHLHRYGLGLALDPPAWLPPTAAAALSERAAWLQPGVWATFLLVGLAAYRVAECAPRLPVGDGRGTNGGERDRTRR